ncbi:MAG: hypothetical protein RL329_2612 [Bacteroidota bacterium]
MTRLVIDIDKPSDLEALLLFLNRLNIKFNKNVTIPTLPETPSIELNYYLSLEVIQKKYPNEWVLLASPKRDGLQIKGGIVLAHHADKREMALQGRNLIAVFVRHSCMEKMSLADANKSIFSSVKEVSPTFPPVNRSCFWGT